MDLVGHSHADTTTLEKIVAGTGFVMTALCMAAGVQFYHSMGGNGFESAVYIGVGLCIAVIAIALLPVTVIAWHNHRVIGAIIACFFWICLMFLQVFAELGFFAASQSNLENVNNVNSIGYAAAKARLDSANARLDGMSSGAGVDVAGLSASLTTLKAQKLAANQKLVKCPKGHNANCKDPLKAEIASLSEEITKLESQLGGSRGYQGIVAERESALKDLQTVAKTDGVATSNIAPVWVYAERFFGKPARTIQVFMIVFMSVLMELWGSYSAYILMVGIGAYKRDDNLQVSHGENPIKNVTPEPEKLPAAAPAKLAAAPSTEPPKKFDYAAVGFSPPMQVTWNNAAQPAAKKS